VGLLGGFFLGKAIFGSAFILEKKQAPFIPLKLVLGNGVSRRAMYINFVPRVRRGRFERGRFETSPDRR
jgi:hypothetical protein